MLGAPSTINKMKDERKQYILKKMNNIRLINYFRMTKKILPSDLKPVNEQGIGRLGERKPSRNDASRPISIRSIPEKDIEDGNTLEVRNVIKRKSQLRGKPDQPQTSAPPTRLPSVRRTSSPESKENSVLYTPVLKQNISISKLQSQAKSDKKGADMFFSNLTAQSSTTRQLEAFNKKYASQNNTSRKTHRSTQSQSLFTKKKPVQMVTGSDAPYKRKAYLLPTKLQF